MLWEDLREEEFDKAIEESGGVCVIPVGCMEAHGQHLPVGTDVIEAEGIVKLAAEIEPVCVFPAFQFGNVCGLVNHKGSVILEPKLMIQLLENICDEIGRNGFKKIMLVNYHGGNVGFLSYFASSIMYKHKDYVVFTRDAYRYMPIKKLWEIIQEEGESDFPELLPVDLEVIRTYVEENHKDGHGGLDETSVVMALRPETVRLDCIIPNSGLSTHVTSNLKGYDMNCGFLWNMDYPNSFQGTDPTGASERIGKVLLRLRAKRQAEACRCLKKAENVMEWNEELGRYYR